METQDGIFDLLDNVRSGRRTNIRDDQYEFSVILDAVETARWRNARFNLIDTGRFTAFELEWLCEAGAYLYTSDEARPRIAELHLLRKAGLRGQALTALWQRGAIENRDLPERLSFSALKEIARSGIIIHLSNRDHNRDFAALKELSEEAYRDDSFLVYYHYGRLCSELKELAAKSARIHLSDRLMDKEDFDLLSEILETGRPKKAGIFLHIERGMPALILRKLHDQGAVFIFKTPPSEPRSQMGILESKARRSQPGAESYYLDISFLI